MKNILQNWGAVAHVTRDELLADPARWRAALYERKLLVLRGLGQLSQSDYYELHRIWGTPWKKLQYSRTTEKWRVLEGDAEDSDRVLTEYGNIITKESIGNRQMPWHRDIPWHREMRYPIRSLYPVRMTRGAGNTGTVFCDCDVLWDRLSADDQHKLLNTAVEIQNWYQFQHKFETVARRWIPLVETHPITGRRSILLNSFGPRDESMPFSTAPGGTWILRAAVEGELEPLSWINHLHELACTQDNKYTHIWEEGDLVLFDNYSGVFHGRNRVIAEPGAERLFWRMNLGHEVPV